MRIALIHDYLVQYGGAERVLEALTEIFPEAPIYTLLYNDEKMNGALKGRVIKTSFLQNIPFAKKHHRLFLALMPLAAESLDLSDYDLIISDSSSYAKGVKKRDGAMHICYCHTPLRYAWDYTDKYIKESSYPKAVKFFLPYVINFVKKWDFRAAQRPDWYIANSHFIAEKIKKYYGREAEVIYPPVSIERGEAFLGNARSASSGSACSSSANFFFDKKNYIKKDQANLPVDVPKKAPPLSMDYYLIVSRLMPYKRVDLAIEAFNELACPPAGGGLKLKIVGDGPDRERLKKTAKDNIEFTGTKHDGELADFYENCKAFIMPQEEDFGIAAVEAQMYGKPVIAFRNGGACESVIENKTGIFFNKQNKDSLIAAIKKFEGLKFDAEEIKSHAQKFSKEEFKNKIKNFIEEKIKNRQ